MGGSSYDSDDERQYKAEMEELIADEFAKRRGNRQRVVNYQVPNLFNLKIPSNTFHKLSITLI